MTANGVRSSPVPEKPHDLNGDSDAPPFFHSWFRLYALVLFELALLIALFHYISDFFQ